MLNTVSRHCARIFFAVALALPPAAPSQSPTTTQDTFHVHGVVLDSHTGKPIARTLVEAYNGQLATLTDHDGRFALTLHFTPVNGAARAPFQLGLLNSGYLYIGLSVRKPGYTQDVTQRQFQQVTLGALEGDLIVKLIPESTIQGRIATVGEDHPQGIRVALFNRRIQNGDAQWAQTSMATTDSRGEFRFAGLQPGRYRLLTQDWSDDPAQPVPLARADKPVSRYAPTGYPASASGPDLKLTAGQVEQVNFNLHPQTYVPVRIPVVLPAGSNPGLQSRVQRPGSIEGAQSGFSLRYNAREKVVEGVLPAGQYEVNLQTNGPTGSAAVVQLTVSGSRVETAPMTLQPMPSIPVIVHQDLTRASQSGNASGSQSSAIAGRGQRGIVTGIGNNGTFSAPPVQVLLIPVSGTSQTVVGHRRIGSDDTVLEPVPPGTYRIEANASEGYIAAVTSGGTDLQRHPLVVTAGSGVEPIEITVRDDTAILRGTVDSAFRNANTSSPELPGSSSGPELFDPSNILLVTCIPSPFTDQRLMQGVVRRDGSFVFNNLPPGSYRVYASRIPMEALEYKSESFTRDYGSKGPPITLEPNGNATVTLTSVIEEIKDP